MEANAQMPIQMSGEEDIGNSYYLAACDNIDMVAADGFGQSGQLQQIVQIIPQTYDKRQLLIPQPASPKYSVATTVADTVTFTQLDGNVTMPIVDGQLSLIESGGQQYLILPNFVTGPTQQIVLQDQPGGQPAVPVRFPEQQTDHVNVPSTLTQLTSLRTVATDASGVQPTFVSAGGQQGSGKPAQLAAVPNAAPVFPKVLQFHDTVQKKTEQVQSTKLDMLHIIPSLYKRTVLQESQADDPNKCKYCSFQSNDQSELDKHYEQHRNEDMSSIEGNQRKKKRGRQPTVKKKRAAQMIRTTVAVEPDPVELPCNCTICDELLSTLKQYKKHMKAHANEKPHRCDECGESFNKERNLNLHKSLHTMLQADGDRAKYQCPECQRTFSRMAGLKMHITMHAEEETFICKECGDEFNLQSELNLHVAEHDNDIERHLHDKNKGISLLIQTESDFENGEGVADRSITVNIEDIPDDLSAIKPSLIQLTQGAPVTSDQNRRKKVRLPKTVSYGASGTHECTVCGKTFQRKSQLTRHNRIHTGEKPYTCSICGKAFNQKCAMQTHFISKHSAEKPFSCPHCPQRYVQRGNLKIHIDRVHTPTDEAAFSCTFCPCTFKRLGSLHAHLTKYHPNRDLTQQRDIGTFVKGPSKPVPEPPEAASSPQNYLQDILEKQDSMNDVQTQTTTEDIVHRALEACAMQNAPLQEPNSTFDLVESDLGLPSEGLEVEKDASAILNIEEQMVVEACMEKTGVQENEPLVPQDIPPPAPEPETGGNVPSEIPVPLTTAVNIDLPENIQSKPAVRPTNEFSLLPPPVPMNVKSLSKLWKVRHVHGTRWHQCIYCPKEFRKPSDLVRHIRVHTLERPYKCRTCFKAFSVKSSLTTHVKTHLGIKPYKCQVCHKSFTTAGSLKVHLRMHTGLKPFHCPHCDKRFRTSGHRKAHVVSHTKKCSSSQMVNARKTPKKTATEDLQIPLQAPLVITADGAVQQYRGKKDSTLSVGSNDPHRPFKCNQCGKAFKKSNHLKQHTRSHTGEKPYKCDQCKRSFISTGILKAHLKTHLGINAFRCQICSQAFSTNGSLKRHALTHSDTRPFMCPYCRKTFKSLVNCRKHIKTHRAELASIQQDGLGSSLQNLGRDIGQTLTSQSTISGLPTVEETLNSTFIGDFAETTEMTDSNIKEVDSNMVQGVENMGPVPADDPQQQSIMLSQPMQQQVLSQDVPMQVQLSNAPLSLEDIEGLSLPVESNAQLLTQHEPVQINHGQAGFSLFGLDMTPQDGGNTLPATDGHNLYTNTMSLLENLNAQPQPTSASLASIQISQTSNAQVTDHGQLAVNNVPPVKIASGRGSERRGKYYGAKPVAVNSRQMYQCTGCEGLFKPEEFVEHSRSFKKCVKELTHVCEFCCHRFKEKTHHESHTRFHRVDSGVVYKCSKCGVGFIDKVNMEEHEQSHGDSVSDSPGLGKRKQCNINTETPGVPHAQSNIGKSNFFRLTDEQSRILSQTNPNLHMTVSERVLLSAVAEKDRVTDKVVQKRGRHKALEVDGYIHKNVCPMCPKSFRKKNDLVRHIRTHTGDRPFSCKQCGKSFAVKSCLFSHERTHSGVKSFRCHICNLMYAAKTSLKVHMRLHTGATPYKCPHCPLKFRTSGHRKNHMATHFTNRATKKKKNPAQSKKSKDGLKSQKSQQDKHTGEPQANPVMISDLTFTLPDGILQGLQAGDGLQLQWNGQTLQLVTTGSTADGEQLTIQLDPTMLQQASSTSHLQPPSHDDVRKYIQPDTSGPAPNLVIQPVSIPDRTRAGSGPHTSTHEINVAVPASLAPLTQQLFQTTPAAGKRNEMNSNNDGLAMLQAIQQLCNSNVAVSGGVQAVDQDQRNQELVSQGITLVNQDGSENQELMNAGGVQPFTFELLSPEDPQGSGNQRFVSFADGALLTSSS